MIAGLAALALLVVVILKALEGRQEPPGEFDDIRSLQRSCEQRQALRRATRGRT